MRLYSTSEPRIRSLLPWAALSFLIGPLGQQFRILLQRDLKFQVIATVEVFALIFGTLASIALAILGYGVYSLIFGQLLTNALDSTLLVVVGWKTWPLRLHFKLKDLRNVGTFGAFQLGERCVSFFAANFDYLIIGKVLGSIALGPYAVAYQLVITPLARIDPIFTRVAFPIFARKQNDDAALKVGYFDLSKFLAFVAFPILVGAAAAAPVLVPVLLGARWADFVILIEILAPLGILKALGNPMGTILLARGRADIVFWFNVYVAIEYLIVFPIFVKSGTTAIAISLVIMVFMNFILEQDDR